MKKEFLMNGFCRILTRELELCIYDAKKDRFRFKGYSILATEKNIRILMRRIGESVWEQIDIRQKTTH